MKKPNFFIIGAPKCGTTSLSSWLSDHPQIYFSPVKEPNYFNEDYLNARNNYRLNLGQYEHLFKDASEQHVAVGEGSVWYLYSRVAIDNILKYSAGCKFIVCLRSPIDMAYSLHQQQIFSGFEDIVSFEEAWGLGGLRKNGDGVSSDCIVSARYLAYSKACALGSQLDNLFSKVHKSKVLLLVLDDIIENPRKEYLKTLEFLGVEDDLRLEFPIINSSKVRRSNLLMKTTVMLLRLKKFLGNNSSYGFLNYIDTINRREIKREILSDEFKKTMLSEISSEIIKIEKYLGRTINSWHY